MDASRPHPGPQGPAGTPDRGLRGQHHPHPVQRGRAHPVGPDGLGRRHSRRVRRRDRLFLRASAQGHSLVEADRDNQDRRPLARARSVAGRPPDGGVQASRAAQPPHAGPGLRLRSRKPALGLRSQAKTLHRPGNPVQDARLQRVRRRASLPGDPQIPPGTRLRPGVLLPILLLTDGPDPKPVRQASPGPRSPLAGAER